MKRVKLTLIWLRSRWVKALVSIVLAFSVYQTSVIIETFVVNFAQESAGHRDSLSNSLVVVRLRLPLRGGWKKAYGDEWEQQSEEIADLADDVVRFKSTLDSSTSMSTARVEARLTSLRDRARRIRSRSERVVDPTDGTSSGEPPVVDSPSETPLVSKRLGKQELIRDIERIEQQLNELLKANADLEADNIETYAVPWFQRALADPRASRARFFVYLVALAGGLLVPLMLAWREAAAGINTVLRLRARARKFEFVSVVVFAFAVGALVVGAVAFVQVGDLVAAEVEAVAQAETKSRLELLDSENAEDMELGRRLELTLQRYDGLIEKEDELQDQIERRLEELPSELVPDDPKLGVILSRAQKQDRVSADVITKWTTLHEDWSKAKRAYQVASLGSNAENRADRARKQKRQDLDTFLEENVGLAKILDDIETESTSLQERHFQSRERQSRLLELRGKVEQEKIKYDVSVILGGGVAQVSDLPKNDPIPVGTPTSPSPSEMSPTPVRADKDHRAAKSKVEAKRKTPLSEPKAPPKTEEQRKAQEESENSDPKTKGEDQPEPKDDSPFASFDLQVSLIRAGVSVFTLFLVQMLLSLQRYITRLSSFYHGRADALELLAAESEDPMPIFGEVASMTMDDRGKLLEQMSPMSVDYSKANAPNRELVDLAKTVVSESTRRG